jgi:hypothetical protein
MGGQCSIAFIVNGVQLGPPPIVHQIVEAEAKLFISGVFDWRPTVTRSFFLENRLNCNAL